MVTLLFHTKSVNSDLRSDQPQFSGLSSHVRLVTHLEHLPQ